MSESTQPDDESSTEPYEPITDWYGECAQTADAWQSDADGEIVAVERGVTHGSRYTVTRFAAPFWEETEPLEYHGRFDDRSAAEQRAREVLENKADA